MAKTTRAINESDSGDIESSGVDNGGNGSDDGSAVTSESELSDVTRSDSDTASEFGDPLSGVTIDPARTTGRSGTKGGEGNGSGRGRRSSTQSGGKNQKTLDLKGAGNKALALQIVGLHHIAGILTGQPVICAITMEQGEALTAAVSEVMSQYKIKPNPKVTAWLNLAGVVGIVYIPKALAFKELAAAKRKQTNPTHTTPQSTTPVPTAGLQFG